MLQQINLYQPTSSDERKPLSAGSAVLALLMIGTGLAGVSMYARHHLKNLEVSVQALRTRSEHQQQQLQQFGQLQAARANPSDVEARNQQLTNVLGNRERALQALQAGTAGRTTGFAARMEALARRHVPGLWLDGMQLSGTSPSMSLQGATTEPDTVPLYLRSLAEDEVLAGTRFDEFVIQRPQPGQEPTSDPQTKQPALPPNAVRFSAGSTSLIAPGSEGKAP